MNAFEFFFSFYGLVLSLSLATLAAGLVRALKRRRSMKMGWLTPLLAVYVALDITTFWVGAWADFRTAPFSYGLIVLSLAIALAYFLAATLVFPDADEEPAHLDAHFWTNRRTVLLLIILSNVLGYAASMLVGWVQEGPALAIFGTVVVAVPFLLLTIPAAFTRRRWLFATLIGLQVIFYLASAALLAWNPAWGSPGDDAPAVSSDASGEARSQAPAP
ncbi:MAG: hypothetical protein EON87_06330 [Brevundimonas sp.]|nr:MAG: hypothetical protein EON87_06330 [Brevundimonas sp.]